jgi:hypothetical protein
MAMLPYGVMAMWRVIAVAGRGPRADVGRRGSPIPTTVYLTPGPPAGAARMRSPRLQGPARWTRKGRGGGAEMREFVTQHISEILSFLGGLVTGSVITIAFQYTRNRAGPGASASIKVDPVRVAIS